MGLKGHHAASTDQDGSSWGATDSKLLNKLTKAGKFSAILETKVNLKKINLDVISKWIHEKIVELVNFEDEILINLIVNMLQGEEVDGKVLQLNITGFLGKESKAFVEELWTLMLDAMNQPSGIPSLFIERKKQEILKRQERSSRKMTNEEATQSAIKVYNYCELIIIYIYMNFIRRLLIRNTRSRQRRG